MFMRYLYCEIINEDDIILYIFGEADMHSLTVLKEAVTTVTINTVRNVQIL